MLEMMMGKPPSGQSYFPNSGPGTKTLQFGTQTLGYFGEVSASELFYGTDIASKFNLAAGQPYAISGSQWFKFFRNGVVIYICRQPVMQNVAWNDVYNAGLVYGVKGNGLYPVGAGVEQFNPIVKNDGTRNWYLVPRLLHGMDTDSGSVDTGLSEWNQLLGRLVTGTNTGVAQKWATLAASYVGLVNSTTFNSMVQESSTADLTKAWSRGNNGDLAYTVATLKSSQTLQYRPVLELIPDTTLLDPNPVIIEPYTLQIPSIVDVRNAQLNGTPALKDPVNVITIWPTKQPVITGGSLLGDALDPVNVIGSLAANLNPFTIFGVSDQLAYDPSNLVYSLANLNPFTISGANAA